MIYFRMDSKRHRRLEAVYLDALSLAPNEQHEFIARELADDPELRAVALGMLRDNVALDSLVSLEEPTPAARPERIGPYEIVAPIGAGGPASVRRTSAGELRRGEIIGAYRLTEKLGEGGMGEVYRARDTKLNRDIAIKVLLSAVANDPDRLARFSREAQVLASLNHPNIAHNAPLEVTLNWTAGLKP
jgi:serine/threonine-protein kinase